MQELHRQELADARVLDLVDDAHPAGADSPRHAVAAVHDLSRATNPPPRPGATPGGERAALAAESKPVRQRGPAVRTVSHVPASLPLYLAFGKIRAILTSCRRAAGGRSLLCPSRSVGNCFRKKVDPEAVLNKLCPP